MKIKRKLMLSSSLALVVAAPMAVAISCSDGLSKDWNGTDSNIDNSSIKINLEKELILSGKDGEGKMSLQLGEGLVGMLLQARAHLKLEVARYKESTKEKLNFQPVLDFDFQELEKNKTTFQEKIKILNDKLKNVNNLMVQDVVKATVTSDRKTFPIKESKDLIITDQNLEYHPLKPSLKMIDSSKLNNGVLEVELDKFSKANTINDVMLSIAKGMGMLMSEDLDVTLGNKQADKAFTPKMLFDTLKNMQSKNIEHIKFSHKDADGKVVSEVFDLFEKNAATVSAKEQLDNTVKEFEGIFNDAKAKGEEIKAATDISKVSANIKTKLSQSGIAERYKDLFEASQEDLTLLVANIHKSITPKKPTTDPKSTAKDSKTTKADPKGAVTPQSATQKNEDLEALENLINVSMAYSNVFRRLKECNFFKDWVETTRLRNIDKIDEIVFSTILRK
ncbi:hypothetical protein [Mycoplasma todarodis]|uniref:hypothetical protein n=1 Tax=Mycoplasma todarodis TaxID=1937191 RepID=UPI003B29BADF